MFHSLYYFVWATVLSHTEHLISAQSDKTTSSDNSRPLTIDRPPESYFRYITVKDGNLEFKQSDGSGLASTF